MDYEDESFVDIDLDHSAGEWFQYFTSRVDEKTGNVIYSDPVPHARVQMRSTAPFLEERLKKQKRRTEFVLNPQTRTMERVPYFDEQPFEQLMREADDLYDYAILALEGFRNKKTGDIIECNRENKIALRRNEVFRRFFERCQQILHGNIEDAAKN